jgi:hypothetical protein
MKRRPAEFPKCVALISVEHKGYCPKVYAQDVVFYATCIVAYVLKARTVAPERQPLLKNDSETTFVSRQRLDKHVPVATDTHETIEVLLETVFSARNCKDSWGKEVSFVWESEKKRGS